MRRLRKQKVREEATIDDLIRALVATNRLLQNMAHGSDVIVNVNVKKEASIFAYTTLQSILDQQQSTGYVLTSQQISDMISLRTMLHSS